MKALFKTLLSLFLLWVLYVVFGINQRLYFQPHFEKNKGNVEVYKQLQYLKIRKGKGAGYNMQKMFPEGLMFFNSLYGLAWAGHIEGINKDSEIFQEGLIEINSSIAEASSDFSQSIFEEDTPLAFGAYYNGWNAYLLGRKLEILEPNTWLNDDILQFKNYCGRIATALKNSSSPYLESYNGQSWPADMAVCMASLALYDRIFEPKYVETRKKWISTIKNGLDSNKLIPHSTHSKNGSIKEGARGSSISLILSFLPEIDSSFAETQFTQFKKLFLEKRLGLKAILEYPKGTAGNGDIDSGPVIWGIGTASTIVSHRAFLANNDNNTAEEIRNGIEAVGFPTSTESTKYFLNGYLDIGDVFIAWTRSSEKKPSKASSAKNWQYRFHLWSLIITTPILLILQRIWKTQIIYIWYKIRKKNT